MASLRDYFDTDFADCFRLQKDLTIAWPTPNGSATANLAFTSVWDGEANARFGTFFVPTAAASADVCLHLIDDCEAVYQREWAGVQVMGGIPRGTPAAMKIATMTTTPQIDAASAALDAFDEIDSRYLVETRQVYLYVERLVSTDERRAWCAYGRGRDRVVKVRDLAWAHMREEREKPVIFISHDSRDKDAIARPLAQALTKLACPVWFDEFSLQIGDSLRESIERGLKNCTGCVLILTPNFFGNGGWTKTEFESVFQREILEKKNVLLPIWAEITKQDVYDYSPGLLNRVGLPWSEGADAIARKIVKALGRDV